MMDLSAQIFCPTCQRFVGDKDRCPYCDWARPAQASKVGQIQWHTTAVADESLSSAPAYPTQLAQAGDLICLPLENGEIMAFDSTTGRLVWQRALREDGKLRTQGLAVWGETLLIGSENLSDLPTRDRALLAWRASNGTDLWNWPTIGDSLSVPLVHEDAAYFASSIPAVYALDLSVRRVRWSVPGLAWSPEAAAVFDQTLIVPSRGPQAAAYSMQDGERLWIFTVDDKETEWLNYRPVATADTAYLSGWRHKLYAVDRLSGERRWTFQAERGLTCAPVMAAGKLLVGVKDFREAEGQRKSGYGLYALDAASGEVVWKVRTDKHVYVPPAIAGDTILLASDDRRLRALSIGDGSEIWQATLPDKLRAGPLVVDERVVVGQRDGALHCVWWKAQPTVFPNPQELLERNQPLDAAAVMALRGDFAGAAHLFEENGEWRAAAELWREANQLTEAARCYAAAQDLVAALGLYRQAGDRQAEARVLAQQGKHAEAAAIYEELGHVDLAVTEYVAAERVAYAAGLLHAAGRRPEAVELYRQAQQDDRVAELLIEEGRYAEAAEIYQRLGKPDAALGVFLQGGFLIDAAELSERLGRLRSAAELYEKAGKTAQALGLYERLQDWQHVAELAEGSGDLPRAAWALTKIGQLSRAAELFERAKQIDPALDLYESLGLWDKVDSLARQTARWGRLAYALLKKGLTSQAGEAYERAAEQARDTQLPPEEVAQLFEEAARCFADEENWLKQSQCWKEVCQLRKWPYVRGQARATSPFFEGEYSLLDLLIQNNGADSARRIHVKSVSQKFLLDITETQEIRSLPAGQSRQLMLSLQPKPGILGRTRLRIRLTYYSPSQHEFEETLECQVEVRSHDEKLVELGHPTPSPITPGKLGYPPGGTVIAGPSAGDEPFVLPEPGDDRASGEPQDPVVARSRDTLSLHRRLTEHFDEEELRDLCFQLKIDYDDLAGAGKSGKARGLITYYERRRELPKLIAACRELRPNVEW